MPDVSTIIDKLSYEQGWCDQTLLDLLTDFIQTHDAGRLVGDLEVYLASCCEEDLD